jgi:hypothetical protein
MFSVMYRLSTKFEQMILRFHQRRSCDDTESREIGWIEPAESLRYVRGRAG